MSTLLLLAVLALPLRALVGVHDPDTPTCTSNNISVVEMSLANILMRNISRFRSDEGQQAVQYLRTHPNLKLGVFFYDEPRAARLNRVHRTEEFMMAYYRPTRGLLLAHWLLHADGHDEETFLRDTNAQARLVDKTALAFVHEVAHARQMDVCGGDCHGPIEGELEASYRASFFLLDVLADNENFDKLKDTRDLQVELHKLSQAKQTKQTRRAILALESRYKDTVTRLRQTVITDLLLLSLSNKIFEDTLSARYAPLQLPSIFSDPARQAEKARGHLKEWGSAGGPVLPILQSNLAYWSDPAAVAKSRRHYAVALAALRAEADRRRKAGQLKVHAIHKDATEFRLPSFFDKARKGL
jgi:hypothetical protein